MSYMTCDCILTSLTTRLWGAKLRFPLPHPRTCWQCEVNSPDRRSPPFSKPYQESPTSSVIPSRMRSLTWCAPVLAWRSSALGTWKSWLSTQCGGASSGQTRANACSKRFGRLCGRRRCPRSALTRLGPPERDGQRRRPLGSRPARRKPPRGALVGSQPQFERSLSRHPPRADRSRGAS